jgi:hypothetical protein
MDPFGLFSSGGASGAVDGAIDELDQSTADQVRLSTAMAEAQGEISAAKSKADIDSAVSRNTSDMAAKIK